MSPIFDLQEFTFTHIRSKIKSLFLADFFTNPLFIKLEDVLSRRRLLRVRPFAQSVLTP